MNAMNGRQLADHICHILRDRGHQAYLVGGCVRDILLGREPADYDVATDATPDRVQELFPNSLAVGAQFGVVIVTDGTPRKWKSQRFAPTSATPTAAIRIASNTPARPKKM